MKKWLLLLLAAVLALSLCACGAGTEEAAEEAAEQAAAETAEQTEGTDDDAQTAEGAETAAAQGAEQAEGTQAAPGEAVYEVELKDGLVLTNYEGDEVFVVFYSFTNSGSQATNASLALNVTALQRGTELPEGALADSDLPKEWAGAYTNTWSYVDPGATVDCCEAFIPKNKDDVDVEVTEFEDLSGQLLANQTFSLE